MTGYEITQSSTSYPLIFLLVLTSDHITGATGLTPTVTLSKNGGAFASPSGAVTEIANGVYKVAGNATDSDTLGPLWLHASGTGTDPCDMLYPVVVVNPQSASYGLSLAKTTNITGFNDIAATAIVSSGAITTSSGKVSEVALVDTLTTYTGNTPQTGDGFARIGSTGSGLTSLAPASTALSTAQWTNTRAGYLDNLSGGAVALASGVTVTTNNDKTGYSLTVSPPTAADIATAVLTDTGDNTTTGTPGKILSQLGLAFTSVTSSVFSTASLVNAPTGGSAPTTAQIVTAIFTNLLSSTDFSTSASIGALLKANTVTSVTGAVGSVTSPVTLTLAQTLNAARPVDTLADTSITLNDVFHCATGSVSCQVDASSGTSLILKTASTGTTLRTKTLTLISPPTTVPDKAV